MTSPDERIIRSQVPDKYVGWRLDKYLAARFTYFSRNRWTHEILRGSITRNGKVTIKIDERLRIDDCIAFDPGEYREPDVDFGYTILYEDELFVAINKTGNLPVHPSGKFFRNTLLHHMENSRNCKFYPIHRLDRETSGIILFGKNPTVASKLQRLLRSAEKTYIAVVKGKPPEDIFSISVALGREKEALISKKQGARTLSGKRARTEFHVLHTNGEYSLIKARPKTGRLHQIRAHLEHAGFPIVGDKLYGGDESCYYEFVRSGFTGSLARKLGFHRTALHARSLKFIHPQSGRLMVVKSPVPPDMIELMKTLFS